MSADYTDLKELMPTLFLFLIYKPKFLIPWLQIAMQMMEWKRDKAVIVMIKHVIKTSDDSLKRDLSIS